MNLVLLGIDADTVELARAAYRYGHRVTAVYIDTEAASILASAAPARSPDRIADLAEDITKLFPAATWSDQWEALLLEGAADAVIVARGSDPQVRDDQLRKLAQAAIPMLAVHPACEAIVGFELDMIRHDTGAALVSYIPGSLHPAMEKLVSLVGGAAEDEQPAAATHSPLGRVEQIIIERSLPKRDRPVVMAQLARDVELVRAVMGEAHKVTALGAAPGEATMANLSVLISSPDGVLARWSVGPVEQQPLGKLTLICTAGRAKLLMPDDERQWTLEIVADDSRVESFPDWDGPAAALQMLGRSLAGQPPQPTWLEACRDVEVAETAERSLARGRAIELHHEQHTEEGTFKGIMAVGGCGILLATLVILMLGAVIGGFQLAPRDVQPIGEGAAQPERWPLLLRIWPVYPFAIFLLLQLLRFIVRPR